MTTEEQLLSLGLPKWPQMLTTGKSVTVEQAKEIIRRTDSFFVWGGGNAHDYNKRVRARLGMLPEVQDLPNDDPRRSNLKLLFDEEDAWRERWGVLATEYVHNSWISCAYVGGPHGWCHPDGQIGFVDNIGKYPSVTAVLAAWRKLAAAFPYLEIGATLMDGEYCEEALRPIVSVEVRDGTATLSDPRWRDVHADHPKATRSGGRTCGLFEGVAAIAMQTPDQRECGIEWAWIEEWGRMAEELACAKADQTTTKSKT